MVDSLNIGCSVLQTDHGMHFYFQGYDLKTNKIGWYTPIGIKADFKLGIKNTADPLRIDGRSRHWLRQVEDYDELPKWLYPTSNQKNSISSINEGERNQGLFNYILELQNLNMSREEIRETIKIINNYILDNPLPKQEIETILRDESFLKESFFKSNTFLHAKFAKYLINEHHIMKINDVLHIYKDGIYSDKQKDIEHVMLKYVPTLTRSKRLEVLSYLEIEAPERQQSDLRYVAVKNGLIDIDEWKLVPFNPSIIIKNKIPVNFIDGAYYDVTDATLNKITTGDKELRSILEEIFGYVLLRRNELGKVFILTGNGSNGKSAFLKMLRQFVGEDNTSSVDLKDLGSRFKTVELFGKLANIGDDISKEYIKDNSEFKKLATGEALNVERKGKDPFDFKNYAKIIFSANEPPKINDHSNGLLRRMLFIPFNAKFKPSDEDFDPYISDKLESNQSLEYMLQLAVQGLKRLLKNNAFTRSNVSDAELKQYEESNNPLLAYLNEEEPKLLNERTKDCHTAYAAWCEANGYKYLNQSNFSKEVCSQLGYTTRQQRKNGKRFYVFVEDG